MRTMFIGTFMFGLLLVERVWEFYVATYFLRVKSFLFVFYLLSRTILHKMYNIICDRWNIVDYNRRGTKHYTECSKVFYFFSISPIWNSHTIYLIFDLFSVHVNYVIFCHWLAASNMILSKPVLHMISSWHTDNPFPWLD